MDETDNLLLVRNFGAMLEAYIEAAGYSSNNTFAEAAGTSPMTVGRCVKGQAGPPLDQLDQWCDALKLRGQKRIDFIRAGWRTKAWKQSEAHPWLKRVEAELVKGRMRQRRAREHIHWWISRAGQLEQFITDAGGRVPPASTDPPPDIEPEEPDDEILPG